MKLVSGPVLRQTAGQRNRRVTLRLRPLLEGQDMTLGERMQRLRPSTTRSQCNLLKPAIHSKFVLALEKFLVHWLLEQLPDWSAATWDAALQDHVELLFEGDKDRSAAACLTSAVLWLAPEFGQPRTDALPWTIASLQGWARLEPGFSRPPLPYAVMMSIVSWLAMHRHWQAGLLTWMLFETYLRVNEALTMHSQDIVRAAPSVTRESSVVKVTACSSSQLLATKTGEQVYVSLPLDLARQRPLALLLCRWAGLRCRGRHCVLPRSMRGPMWPGPTLPLGHGDWRLLPGCGTTVGGQVGKSREQAEHQSWPRGGCGPCSGALDVPRWPAWVHA